MIGSKATGRGKGWRGDRAEHARVGRLGGKATARTHDAIFYSRIGRIGGRISPGNFARDPERARLAGQKGGRVRGKRSE